MIRLTLLTHDSWNEQRAFLNPKDAEAFYFEATEHERADPANAKWAASDEDWIKWGIEENGNWAWEDAIVPDSQEQLIRIKLLATDLAGAIPSGGRFDWFVEAIGQLFEQLAIDDTPEEEQEFPSPQD